MKNKSPRFEHLTMPQLVEVLMHKNKISEEEAMLLAKILFVFSAIKSRKREVKVTLQIHGELN